MQNNSFRYDINGLRAIAVLAVVLFHFSPNILPGGFVGVDIFFVISGYLMTSIIFRGLKNNNFSFKSFLINRATRIVPALLAMVFILLLLGYATLGPDAYKILAVHGRDSLLFISNITYNNESGYFDTASNTKFLLHTWSLSVEWQFYIIYPIIILFFKRFLSTSILKILIVFLLIISFITSIIVTKYNPETAYFMFYTRAWEMMFGGLAFLYPIKASISNKTRYLIEFIGLIIISIAIFKINNQTPWPGYMALLPVIGTYFCILAYNNNTILSGYIFNKIGLWSYSIYLVHWPVIVFNNILDWNLSFKKYIFIVFVLAFLLYQLVEKRRNYKYGLLLSFIMVLLLAIYVSNTNGIESRFNIPKDSLTQGNVNSVEKEWQTFNNKNHPYDYVFYGDSFSSQYASYLKKRTEYIALLYRFECLNTPNFYSYRNYCKNQYEQLKKELIKKSTETLVISQAWSWAKAGLKDNKTDEIIESNMDQFIDKLEKELSMMVNELPTKKIVIIGVNNHFLGIGGPKKCLETLYVTTLYESILNKGKEDCREAPLRNEDYVENLNLRLNQLAQKKDWLYFINPNDAVCKNNMCLQIKNNQSLYADNSHFSTVGADIVGKYIFDELEKIQKGDKGN